MPINTIQCPNCSARINYVVSNEDKSPTVTCRRCGQTIATSESQLDSSTRNALADLLTLSLKEEQAASHYAGLKADPECVEKALERVSEVFTQAKAAGDAGSISDYIVDVTSDFGIPDVTPATSIPSQTPAAAEPEEAPSTSEAPSAPQPSTSSNAPQSSAFSSASRPAETAERGRRAQFDDDAARAMVTEVLLRKFKMSESAAGEAADFIVYLTKNGNSKVSIYQNAKNYGRQRGYSQEDVVRLVNLFKNNEIYNLLPKRFRSR